MSRDAFFLLSFSKKISPKNSGSQQFKGGLSDVADEETEDTFIIVHLEGAGKGDHGNEVINKGGMGSWNVSRTNGPLGAPCQLPRPEANEEICYKSCPCKYNIRKSIDRSKMV